MKRQDKELLAAALAFCMWSFAVMMYALAVEGTQECKIRLVHSYFEVTR